MTAEGNAAGVCTEGWARGGWRVHPREAAPVLGRASPAWAWWTWPGQGNQVQPQLGVRVEVDPSNPLRFGDLERTRAGLVVALPAPWDGETWVREDLMSL